MVVMEDIEKVRALALKLLARREHSRLELEYKMARRRFGAELVREVLDDCEQRGWLDDERFADVYGRGRIDAGYGPLRIRMELEQRGVHREPACLQQASEEQWQQRCRELRHRRFGSGPVANWEERVRQMRFLQRRGFAHAHIDFAMSDAGLPDETMGPGEADDIEV